MKSERSGKMEAVSVKLPKITVTGNDFRRNGVDGSRCSPGFKFPPAATSSQTRCPTAETGPFLFGPGVYVTMTAAVMYTIQSRYFSGIIAWPFGTTDMTSTPGRDRRPARRTVSACAFH